MKTTPRLYDAVTALLGQHPKWQDVRHLQTLAWMVVGLIQTGQVYLSEWVSHVKSRALFAQSTQRRFARWLNNPRIKEQELYAPLIRHALSVYRQKRLVLVLDTTMLWDTYCVVRLSLVYRGRAIPLVWNVKAHASAMVSHQVYESLLDHAATLLPSNVDVLLLADRGFADVKLMQQLSRLKWHYRIRVRSTMVFYRGKFRYRIPYCPLSPGQALFIHSTQVTRHRYGPVHLALAHQAGTQERWYVVSDEPTSTRTFEEYQWRFTIEESFLDDKSNGFQLEGSQIRSEQALSRLCLVLAVTTLYLVAQGTQVVDAGQRRRVDTHWFRGNSYLKIGWHWLHKCLAQGWPISTSIGLSPEPDPEPAISSRQQAARKLPLYFRSQTVDWSAFAVPPPKSRRPKAA